MKIVADSRTRPSQLQGAMTDISFNLIIFFMVAASFVAEQGLFLLLPEAESEPRRLPPSRAVLVELDNDADRYVVDGKETTEAGLGPALEESVRDKLPEVVVLEAADGVAYGRVFSTLEKARMAGASSFSVNGKEGVLPVSLEEEGP